MKWKKLNLQLFADAHEQLQNTTGSSGMSAEMKTFYERRLIDQALPALVHDQFGDTIVRDILAGGTNVIYAPKVSDGVETLVTSRAGLDATAQLTVDLIEQAVAQLKVQNADPVGSAGGSYVCIIHPYTAYDLKKDPAWVEAHKYASPDEIFEGEIGKIGNVRFVETSEAKIWTGTGCPSGLAVFGTLVLGAHAYATTELEGGGLQHIVKQLGYGDDPLNQRASVGWKAVKTAERLSEQYMVRIESCSARYSAKAKAN